MKEENIEDVLWRLFESTGEVNYYEFYKSLKDGDKDGSDSNSQRRL